MKAFALMMMVVVLVFGAVLGYGLFHANLQVIGKDLQVFSAASQPAQFEQLRVAVERNALVGTWLKNTLLSDAENYQYHVYTLRVENKGLVDAEMVEIQIAPLGSDVLYYGESGEVIIKAGQTRDIWCVLLTEGQTHDVRNMYITYYLWGNPYEVKFTYDNTL